MISEPFFFNAIRILKHQELKTKSASSKRGSENLDPNASGEAGKGVSKLKGISRLPVLAKSLQPALSALSQNPSHNSWEQRPLTVRIPLKCYFSISFLYSLICFMNIIRILQLAFIFFFILDFKFYFYFWLCAFVIYFI